MKTLRLFILPATLLLLGGCSQSALHPAGNATKESIQAIDTASHSIKQVSLTRKLRFLVKRKTI